MAEDDFRIVLGGTPEPYAPQRDIGGTSLKSSFGLGGLESFSAEDYRTPGFAPPPPVSNNDALSKMQAAQTGFVESYAKSPLARMVALNMMDAQKPYENPMGINIPLLQAASGFLAPTRAGSFGESIGQAGERGAAALQNQANMEQARKQMALNAAIQGGALLSEIPKREVEASAAQALLDARKRIANNPLFNGGTVPQTAEQHRSVYNGNVAQYNRNTLDFIVANAPKDQSGNPIGLPPSVQGDIQIRQIAAQSGLRPLVDIGLMQAQGNSLINEGVGSGAKDLEESGYKKLNLVKEYVEKGSVPAVDAQGNMVIMPIPGHLQRVYSEEYAKKSAESAFVGHNALATEKAKVWGKGQEANMGIVTITDDQGREVQIPRVNTANAVTFSPDFFNSTSGVSSGKSSPASSVAQGDKNTPTPPAPAVAQEDKGVITKPGVYTSEALKHDAEQINALSNSFNGADALRERMKSLASALKVFKSGTFAEAKANIVAAADSLGLDVSSLTDADPTQVQKMLKDATAQAFEALKAFNPRATQMEFGASMKSFAGPDLQPAANRAILAKAIGIIDRDVDKFKTWQSMKGDNKNWRDFNIEHTDKNPLSKFTDAAYKGIGPLYGEKEDKAMLPKPPAGVYTGDAAPSGVTGAFKLPNGSWAAKGSDGVVRYIERK